MKKIPVSNRNLRIAAWMIFLGLAIASIAFGAEPARDPSGILYTRYVVIMQPGKDLTASELTSADVTVLGRAQSWIEVTLPEASIAALRANPKVRSVQRVVTSEERPRSATMVEVAAATTAASPWSGLRASAQSVPATWSSGGFLYDPSGNIYAIGTPSTPNSDGKQNVYTYDTLNRLTGATVNTQDGNRTETYQYDDFGNMNQIIVNGSVQPIPIDPLNTNRLAAMSYDANGNVIVNGAESYSYDALNMMKEKVYSGGDDVYIYTASDERTGVKIGDTWTWSLRDFNGKVIRQYQSSQSAPTLPWVWVEDYVYRDGALTGAQRAANEGGRQAFHLDHLGTPRMVTGPVSVALSRHDYTPWGIEVSPWQAQPAGFDREDPLRFTGHERDFTSGTLMANTNYLDYMHARYYNGNVGRFLSVDPGGPRYSVPQSLNRYSYVMNRPMTLTDPTGRVVEIGSQCLDQKTTCRELQDIRNAVAPELRVFVQPQLHNGKVILNNNLLRAGLSHGVSANYLALTQVATNPQMVEFRSSVQLTISQSENGKVYTTSFAPLDANGMGLRGTTLVGPSNYPSHKNAVYINPFETDAQRAEDVGHELLGHMSLYLAGRPWQHSRKMVWVEDLQAFAPDSPQDNIISARQHEAGLNAAH